MFLLASKGNFAPKELCFNLSGGSLKDWCKTLAFVSPNSEFSQGRETAKQETFLEHIERQMNNCCHMGHNRLKLGHKINMVKTCRSTGERVTLRNKDFEMFPCITRNLESQVNAQGRKKND